MKKSFVFAVITFITLITTVSAKEVFYTNTYGVEFSKEEYNFITNFYFEGYQNYMNINDYNQFVNSNIMNGKITSSTIYFDDNQIQPQASDSHATATKSLKINSSCYGSSCSISTIVDWLKIPNIKSYDVIGAYLSNTEYLGNLKTNIYYNSSNTSTFNNNKFASNGLGTSIKLPSQLNSLKIVQEYNIKNQGTIYASYQHAKKTSTLAKSQQYNFATSGYGNVFLFDSTVRSYYDGMGGVSLNL